MKGLFEDELNLYMEADMNLDKIQNNVNMLNHYAISSEVWNDYGFGSDATYMFEISERDLGKLYITDKEHNDMKPRIKVDNCNDIYFTQRMDAERTLDFMVKYLERFKVIPADQITNYVGIYFHPCYDVYNRYDYFGLKTLKDVWIEDTGKGCFLHIPEFELIKEEKKDMNNCNCLCSGVRSNRYPWNKKEEKDLAVTKVVTHNNRVVITYFDDGTFTKAVCSENDTFDLDVGYQVCIMKKIFGTKNYYKFMNEFHKFMDDQEKEKIQKNQEKKERREKQKAKEMKNAAKRQAHIDQYKNDISDAVLAALEAHDNEQGDDRK